MSLPFSIALSSLQANQTAIEVVGNNLANLNTKGYKANSIGFTDVMLQMGGSAGAQLQVGAGVATPTTVRTFTQGGIESTGGFLDAAIQGNGFFIAKNTQGQSLYTRAGNFVLDKNGKLTASTGEAIQGWTGSGLSDIVISTDPIPAVPSSKFTLTMNLNASDPQPFSAPVQVIDAAGRTVDITIRFSPVTDAEGQTVAGQWNYVVNNASTSSTTAALASGTLTFDASGQLQDPPASSAIQLSIPTSNGGTQTVTWNLSSTDSSGKTASALTQLALPSKISALEQDGSPASDFVRAKITDGGRVMSVYSDGREIQAGQLALATLINPESLVSVGGNFLAPGAASGSIQEGAPSEGGRGQILSGSLESSTVDLAGELTALVTFQRGYQASSRIITTADELMQEALALKR
jgi:flagellar hook protein FlgE